MFIPKAYAVEDWAEIVRMVREVRAGDLVSVDSDGAPISTLMPCIWSADPENPDELGILHVHIARANKQWKSIKPGAPGLAIFNGPQGYVSASNYAEKKTTGRVVSTWNYTSVHLHGELEVIDDPDYVRNIVMELTRFHESDRVEPWDPADIDIDYLATELQGIVAITMKVTRVEAKAKMSQNHTEANRQNIIADFRASHRSEDHLVADVMQEILDKKRSI